MKANSLEELVTSSNIAGELRNYTDWHTRLVKFAQLVADWQKSQMLEDVEFDSQVFGKVMSDILAVYKSPSNPEEEPLDYEWTIARQSYELGKENMKEQMMKDAVKGQVYGSDCDHLHWVESEIYENPKWKEGDKVRLIVLKEEEE